MPLEILYEDNHLLAVNKRAGMPTQGAAAGAESVVQLAKEYLRKKYNKPGNVYLGVVSRLDSPVSGVVVLARTSKAAARLNEQFRGRTVQKRYWALVAGRIEPPSASCVDLIAKDERSKKMVLVKPPNPATGVDIKSTASRKNPAQSRARPSSKSHAKAQEAKLSYRRLKLVNNASLLEIELETGRKHQIRLQLAARGHPLLGDKKYGSQRSFPNGIALHCRQLIIQHPTLGKPIEFVAPPPKAWRVAE
ncbi:MAG TPA: RluA family pseudouridine synthase [Pirellulales bacterium]|jgi:23S rRNA pseudouridine1911/1915/1917 synthase